MPNTKILNGLVNRIGNFDPNEYKNSFDTRLILQKTIYLLQAFGLNIGFHYNWYLRGPYSPDLTRVAYEVVDSYDDEIVAEFDNAQDEERFSHFLQFIENKKNDHYKMEAVASIHFLAKLYGEKNEGLVFEEVRQKMRRLDHKTFTCFWDELCQNGLFSK